MNRDIKIFKIIGILIVAIGCNGIIMSWLVCDLQSYTVIIVDIIFCMVAFIGLLVYEAMERLERRRKEKSWEAKRRLKTR